MLKKHTPAWAVAHHTLYMYQSMTHSAHWKPVLLFTDSDQYNVSGTHTFYNYTYDVMSLDLVRSDNVDTIIESCTNVGRGFQRKYPNIHIVYFNQGPDFFISMNTYQGGKDNLIVSPNRFVDTVWTTAQYTWQGEYIKTMIRASNVEECPYVWEPDVYLSRSGDYEYVPNTSSRVGVYETNRGIYKMSMIPMLAIQEMHRQHGIEFAHVGCLWNLNSTSFVKKVLNRYPSLFHGTPEFVSIPKTWDTNRIGTVVSHTLRNGLNYLWLEAIYSKMAVVHNSEHMLECGYYYDDFNVTDAKFALYDAVHNHDARFSEQMEKRAACLHKFSTRNPSNVLWYERLLNKTLNTVKEYTMGETSNGLEMHLDRRPTVPFITSDGFRSLCTKRCEFPAGCNFKASDVKAGDCIYVHSTMFMEPFFGSPQIYQDFASLSRDIRRPYVLITGGLETVVSKYSKDWDSPYLAHWFYEHDSVQQTRPSSQIPTGVENRWAPDGAHFHASYFKQFPSEDYLLSQVKKFVGRDLHRNRGLKPKQILDASVFFGAKNVTPGIVSAYSALSKKWFVSVKVNPSHGYMKSSIHNHDFAVCPHERDENKRLLDSHCVWETLLIGSIPIVLSGHMDSVYADLPVFIVDNWENVTLSRLNDERERLSNRTRERAYFEYWREEVVRAQTRAREPLTPVVEYAKSMQRRNGFVYVQFLNEAFVPMTLNWLCHTDAKVVLKTLFIATDEAAERALRKVVKHVVFLPFASGELSYGQRTYYDYMLFRTRTLSALLQSDVSVWLIESDATWFGDPEPHLPRGYDIVVGQDGYFHEDIPEAGFVFLNATEKTKRMWQSLSEQQAAALQDAGSGWLDGKGSEMLMLPGQIVKHGLRRGDFPRAFFVGGKWYQNATFRDMVKNPVVIQNNWIIGNGPKIKRAQQWGHWYLNQSNECPSLTDHVVFTTFKPNASGHRRQIESNFLKNIRQLKVRSVVFADDEVDTNVHGTPVLGKMYTRVFEMYPHAKTYTFVNGDILFNDSFVEAADALYNMTTVGTLNRRFLAVGTRTNVDWTSEITPANFSSAFASGFLANPQSSDFFMVTRETFDWENEIPPFVIGRPYYDNWLMHYAQTLSEVELVDVTRAVPSLHMTGKLGNREHAVSPKPDQQYNLENIRWTKAFSTGTGYYQTFEGETLSARLRLVRPYALRCKHTHTVGIWYNGTQSLDTYRKLTKAGFDCYLLVRGVTLNSWSLTIDGERFNARYYSAQLGGLSYAVVPSTLYEEVHKSSPHVNLFRYEVNVPSTFEIIVLTMNRAKSVMRLLKSLEASEYGSEQIQLTIHVDYRAGNQDTVDIVKNYSWPHGSKRVVVRQANIGLMRAWLNAWSGKSDRFIIFEDDITVSPKWYTWLQRAWDQYESRTDMAGISIMRQTLIPKLPDWGFWREIENDHAPFLYKLMGSIGFSPHPTRWREFLDWMAQLKDDFDPSVPGLITTHWWQHHPKGSMWEAHFIYKNIQDGLYTMYVNLPKGETLAANMREQGEHYTSTEGADFPLATNVAYHFPKQLQKYDWDGSKEIRPTIAVAIPCIAEDLKELPALKKSIEQQTSPPDEIVLVVSNTTSCPSFDGWTIVCRKEQLLSGLARNLAWETASSDIISFVDADDEMYPERISLIRSYFENQPKLQMLLHDHARHPIHKHKQMEYPVASIDGHVIYKAAVATPHLRHLPIAGIHHGHVTIRRDIPCAKFGGMKRFQDSVFVRECVYKLGDDADSMSALQVPLTRYIERAERIVNKFKSPFGGGGGLNQKEMILLTRKYGEPNSVFEWGIGDSSLLASLAHVNRLVGVDSAVVWVKQVQKHTPSRFDIRHINIGPVGGWGYPEDDSRKPNWPDYSTAPRQDQPFDFYFVDGRFRVACVCQALLHGHSNSRVALHDFRQNRPYYRVILDVADVVEQVDSLVVFKRKPGATDKMIMHMWETYKYDKR